MIQLFMQMPLLVKLWITMKQIIPTPKYILSKRAKIMKFLKEEGYTGSDIAVMFNIDKSGVSRILKAEKNYKEFVKLKLQD
jgi:predicted transcriptional regulator